MSAKDVADIIAGWQMPGHGDPLGLPTARILGFAGATVMLAATSAHAAADWHAESGPALNAREAAQAIDDGMLAAGSAVDTDPMLDIMAFLAGREVEDETLLPQAMLTRSFAAGLDHHVIEWAPAMRPHAHNHVDAIISGLAGGVGDYTATDGHGHGEHFILG